MHLPRPVLRTTLRTLVKPVLQPRVPFAVQRAYLDAFIRATPLPAGTVRASETLGGRPCLRIAGPGAAGDRAVLYLHGGGYTTGSLVTHRPLAATLAHGAGAPVHLLDYRLAPEHPFPAALDDAEAAYRELLERGIPATGIAVAGDSAGAGLAMALLDRLRAAGTPLPAVAGLISPWLDLTLSGPTITAYAERDPLLNVRWLSACADAYAGGGRLDQPGLSPLAIDLDGLPPIVIQAGADDVLVSDADRFVERARAAGHPVEYRRFAGLWHDFQLQAGLLADAGTALSDLGGALRAASAG
ncbi:alpha/beta hydrolase [Patulibacter defluvii]|uniref:alpha/beta hydrolase n=1 Tax=Patulibacter defluvii TaxID=3095358 RepID=UPI002A766BEC|nr:alpha/beta hydrolase [Patulibacter sp. DM4]